jgi:hypothetical protein
MVFPNSPNPSKDLATEDTESAEIKALKIWLIPCVPWQILSEAGNPSNLIKW